MKYYLPFLVVFLFIACKKSNFNNYAAGSEKRMTITEHNVTIQGVNEDGHRKDEAIVDLDNDGWSDVKFSSQMNNAVLGEEVFFGDVKLFVTVNDFDVLVAQNSGDYQITYGASELSTDGPIPTVTSTKITSCKTDGDETTPTGLKYARNFSEGAILDTKEYDWSFNKNLYNHVQIATSAFEYEKCEFNETNDTIFCDKRVFERNCFSAPIDQKTYILFRKHEEKGFSIGWIELLLTDENKLTILRSAISNKVQSF